MLEAHARLQAEFLEKGVNASPDEFAGLAIDATIRQFDIIASAIVVTTTDYASVVQREASITEASIVVLAWLEQKVRLGPRWMREQISMTTARMRLQQGAAQWIAQAVSLARESHNRAAEPSKAVTRFPPEARTTPKQTFRKRAVWLQEQLDRRRWTAQDLARHGGPSWRTVRKILAGEAVRETVLEKLAQALSLKESTRLRDIPNS